MSGGKQLLHSPVYTSFKYLTARVATDTEGFPPQADRLMTHELDIPQLVTDVRKETKEY